MPMIYALPKTHKSTVEPPGFPIVSGIGCLTEKASQVVDDYLRPHVLSYIQESGYLGYA